MSNPNHRGHIEHRLQTSGSPAQSDPLGDEVLESLAAKLAQLQPIAPRPLELKVFYEMGYQAGCRVATTKPQLNVSWPSYMRRYGLAAACICLALAGGFIAGQWRARDAADPVPVALTYIPADMPTDDSQHILSPTTAYASPPVAPIEPPETRASSSWWPVADPQLFYRQVTGFSRYTRYGMRIGPAGSAWEDLVVRTGHTHGRVGSRTDLAPPAVDEELQQLLELSAPGTQTGSVQRFKKWIYPLL